LFFLLQQYELLQQGGVHSFLEEEAFERVIEYFQQNELPDKALEAAQLAVERYPYSSALLIRKADVLVLHRRYKEALRILDQAEILDSRDINIFILRTDAYLALDQPEKAVHLLEKALGQFEGEEKVELLFELADVYDDYEDFDKVFDCLKEVLTVDPLNEEALYKICFWTDFTGRNEEGIRLHQEIIDEHPFSELAWFNLGAAYQGLKLYEKAIDAYKYAVAIEDKFDYAYRNMGDAYIRLHRYKDAIEVLERVHELAKPEDIIYEAIGFCYEKLKQPALARLQYRKASHLRKDDSRLFYKIACTYYAEAQWSEHYLIALQAKPKKIGGWEALIHCLYAEQAWEEVLRQANLALQATKGKVVFLYYKAAALFGADRNKEALQQLEEALEKDPRQAKKLLSLRPSVMQLTQVVELLAKFKRKR